MGGNATHAHKIGAPELKPATRIQMPKPIIPAEIT
jgi:hypothetical protein